MLRPLIYLFTLISLAGALESFSTNKEFDISSCPLTYYEKFYTKLYVSFTSNRFVVCFNGFYNTSVPDDCIRAPSSDDGSASFDISTNTMLESLIKQKLYIDLVGFGNQTALGIVYTVPPAATRVFKDIDAYVEGSYAADVSATQGVTRDFTDISGCRAFGKGFFATGLHYESNICTDVICSLNRSLTITPRCNDGERCDGSGVCLMNQTCTLTGPAVIDIHGGVDSVEDRCSYTLVSGWSYGYTFLANFRDRRRKDVSLVDSVTVRSSPDDIVLGQGGSVQVGDSLLTLNSSIQDVNGIQLFKDQTGVHAIVPTSRRFASVFFDGDTAQIQIEVPVGGSLDGLCGNSGSFSSAKASEDSSSGCGTVVSEAADTTIDCSVMAEHCNLLKEEPFSSCNAVVDPAPYIAACNETLCKYPAVDGLKCQFLWAYARACSLSNATLEDWWLEAECSPPEAFCQDQVCSDHEFCGLKSTGAKGCLCRAVFASSYKESNTLGDPTVCTQNSASVTLVGCLLEERNIDYSLLHLKDETCKGEKDPESHMVTFSFDSSNTCGAEIMANNSYVTYKNTIMDQNISSAVITRQDQINIDFSCVHIQPEMKTVAFRIKDISVVQHIASGEWNYTVTMKAYTDADRTQAVDSSTDVVLNQKIWVELDTEGLDADLVAVVTDSCWATAQESSSSTPRYDLIQNGCFNAEDQTVMVENNGEGTSSYFSFSMFQFTGNTGDVYLHCKLKLCVKEGSSCIPECSGGSRRRRRSARYKRGASAFITMAWIN